jgi:peptidoglycan-associated lipoprotein
MEAEGAFYIVVNWEAIMTIHSLFAIVLVAGTTALAGCATRSIEEPTREGGYGYGVDETAPGEGQTSGLEDDGRFELDPLQDPDSPLAKRVIYFDFDSDQVKADSLRTVNAHGQYLANNGGHQVRLEGHADERGSREYNLSLGERRAQSVRRLLQLQGVLDDQIEIISYGEELPSAPGHGKQSWALNRRVEIVYGAQ